MESGKLTSLQKDVLREIGNIGAGNATTSLSELINNEVKMEVPSVNQVSINELMDIIGGPEKVIVAILFKIQGEISGTVYFILTLEEAEFVIEQMTTQNNVDLMQDGKMNEWTESVLMETANILTGSYLSALADFTNLHMKSTVPLKSVDMAAATLVTGLIEISEMMDDAIIIDTKITGTDTVESAKGHFLLIPDPDSILKLFSALGMQHDE